MKKGILAVLLVLLVGILGVSLWQILGTFSEYHTGADSYAELEQYISIPEADEQTDGADDRDTASSGNSDLREVEVTKGDDIVWPRVNFEALREINPDVAAWIYIPGTEINYPVVQGEDNDYYLSHLFDGTANSSGCIFLDAQVPGDFSAQNSVLHGHHMKNGSMFAGITDYKQQSFYDEHPVALLLTPEKNYEIRFFSGYVTDVEADAWDPWFAEGDYQRWLEKISAKSCFTTDVQPGAADRIVTLSTCSYEYDDARFVLHGVIVE